MMRKDGGSRLLCLLTVLVLLISLGLAQRPELQRDSQLIRNVQEVLEEKGYDPGPLDGIMGPRTRSAIEAFQRDSGLAVNGQMDDATLKAMGVEIPTKEGSDSSRQGVVGTVGKAGETAGRATAKGATAAAKGTAKGATAAAKGTAKGATVAGKATAEGATTAGKATARGASTAADATAEGAKKAAGSTRRFLFGSSLKDAVEKALREDANIDLDDVDVKVDDGVVTLRFKRGSRSEWNRAVRAARSVESVKEVKLETP